MMSRRKLILIIITFAVLSVVGIISAIVYRVTHDSGPAVGEVTSTVDQTTGETVISTEGKVPELAESDGVLVLGAAKLLSYGVSSVQVDRINSALNDYGLTNETYKRISIDPNKITMVINPDSGQTDITTEIAVNNDVRQKVVMSYVGTTDMLVRIYATSDNAELFSSGDDEH
jgi:hypothetical protein